MVCGLAAAHDRRVRYGRYRITVESSGRRTWFRLWLGSALLADNLATPAEVERELARHGLTLADFEDEPGNGGEG